MVSAGERGSRGMGLLAGLVLLCVTSCQSGTGATASGGRATTGSQPSEPTFATTTTTAGPLWKGPRNACAAVPQGLAAELKLNRPEGTEHGKRCQWRIGNDKFHQPDLYIQYEAWHDVSFEKQTYDRMKQSDLRAGRGFGFRVLDKGEMRQIGSRRKTTDFDEGYYFYGHEEVVAGLKVGTGTMVLRKGNLHIEIQYRGDRITGKVQGRLISKPDSTDAAKEIIDKVADAVFKVVVRA